jgi:transposase
MRHEDAVFIGVDVSQCALCSCVHGSGQREEVPNEQSAILAWLASLPPSAQVAMESTGRHHQALARLVHASGRRVFVLNARDIFFYAKALGARGKTDRKDAQVIARYLAEHHRELKPWVPAASLHERLQQLLRCRAGVAHKRSALRQVLRDMPSLQASIHALQQQFDALLGEIDAQIAAAVREDAQFSSRCAKLRTITGIGAQGSAMLAVLFSRFKFANANAVVAYSGLDPRPDDSGRRHGKRHISKRGSPELRRQLYLAAFAAAHSNALGPLYRSIKAKGFKPTQALVILARKLLRVAWAVWKGGNAFDARMLGTTLACAKT